MADVFDSPRATFRRAQQHITEFKKITGDFVSSRPWTYIIDKHSQPGQDIHKIQFTIKPPDTLPSVLFDIANNLRSVLDQVGYAAAIAGGKTAPKRTAFPFADDLAGLDNNLEGRGVAKDVPAGIVTLFRGFKPYKGGNDTLWALNKLCNTKKHRALVPLDVTKAEAKFSARLPDDFVIGSGRPGSSWNPDRKELILAIVAADLRPKINGNFTFDLGIEGIETQNGIPAVGVLNAMSGIVERVLLATEAECRRIGIIP